MKNIFLAAAAVSMVMVSCRKDAVNTVTTVPIETQNTLDDQAIVNFLSSNYLDAKGNIQPISELSAAELATTKKLAELSPVTLPSGVVYILRPNAQPIPGTPVGSTDVIRLMSNSQSFLAVSSDKGGVFSNGSPFMSSFVTGALQIDPKYFYASPQYVADYNAKSNAAPVTAGYFMIEGLSEALTKFRSFEKADAEDYNMQGVILVPSRAAFARDAHFNYSGFSLNDRTFVFNFQLYKASPR